MVAVFLSNRRVGIHSTSHKIGSSHHAVGLLMPFSFHLYFSLNALLLLGGARHSSSPPRALDFLLISFYCFLDDIRKVK